MDLSSSWLSRLPDPLRRGLQRTELGLALALAAVIVLAMILDTQHNYWHNPRDSGVEILRQTAMLGIFALGAAIVIIAGGIDLSSGSVISLSGSVCATLMLLLAPQEMRFNKPLGLGVITLAIFGTLIVGLLVGSLHAWLITVVELPPFVATLASLVGLRSLARALVGYFNEGRSQISIFDERFRYLATSVWIPVILLIVLSLLAWLTLSRTVTGRHLYALGGNENAARLSGIQTNRLKWLAYCISALLSSVAGVLYAGAGAAASPETVGKGYELNAIAAAVVGGCSLQGGVGTIPGTVLGCLFLRCVIDGVAKIIKTSADIYEGVIVGGVVVVAVAFTQLRRARRRGKRFFPGSLGIVSILALSMLIGVLAMLFGQKLAWGGNAVGGIAGLAALLFLSLAWFFEQRRERQQGVRASAALPARKQDN
ncbi:MAG TPA: ABC transporter permease [Gemmataceae bacterium]|nr:ABC transporter permease [Gemmataceae bacterium]